MTDLRVVTFRAWNKSQSSGRFVCWALLNCLFLQHRSSLSLLSTHGCWSSRIVTILRGQTGQVYQTADDRLVQSGSFSSQASSSLSISPLRLHHCVQYFLHIWEYTFFDIYNKPPSFLPTLTVIPKIFIAIIGKQRIPSFGGEPCFRKTDNIVTTKLEKRFILVS